MDQTPDQVRIDALENALTALVHRIDLLSQQQEGRFTSIEKRISAIEENQRLLLQYLKHVSDQMKKGF